MRTSFFVLLFSIISLRLFLYGLIAWVNDNHLNFHGAGWRCFKKVNTIKTNIIQKTIDFWSSAGLQVFHLTLDFREIILRISSWYLIVSVQTMVILRFL